MSQPPPTPRTRLLRIWPLVVSLLAGAGGCSAPKSDFSVANGTKGTITLVRSDGKEMGQIEAGQTKVFPAAFESGKDATFIVKDSSGQKLQDLALPAASVNSADGAQISVKISDPKKG
jgi:hypothetical protein